MQAAALMIDGAFDSGLTTVRDVLAAATVLRSEVEHPPPPWEVTVVGMRGQMLTAGGLTVPTASPDCLDPAPDVVVVPALGLLTPAELVAKAASEELRPTVELVRRWYDAGSHVAAACSGTLLLAEAGVLDGQEATTSWWLGADFRERYPAVRLDTSASLLVGDRVSTAGAAFAHIDLALSLVQRHSPALADLVARYLLIGERASQASYAAPAVVARHSPEMAAFERWVRAHLHEPFRIATAAAAVGLSERTLQRVTAAATGLSPLDFVGEVRLDEAAFLLRSTTLTTAAVAERVGYRNPGTLRALVRRRRGMTLGTLRRS